MSKRKPAVVEAPPEVAAPEVEVETAAVAPVEEAPAPTVVLGKEVMRKLRVAIDDPTLSAYGNELADLIQTLEQLDSERKAAANEFKCKIDSASARARELANLIRAKCRYLDVTCREERNFQFNEFVLRRLDTFEAIERRPLREDEKQAELALEEIAAEEEEPAYCNGCAGEGCDDCTDGNRFRAGYGRGNEDEEGRPDLDDEEPLPETEQNCATCADCVSCETRAADGGPCDKWAASPVEDEDEDEETPE